MTMRVATRLDAPAIVGIWNPFIANSVVTFNSKPRTEDEVAEMIATRQANGHAFFVAEEAGEILGFATYDQFRGGVGYARTMEHTIILSDTASGKGIGRALMAEIEDHARAAGAHSMLAGVAGENTDGVAFHAALGYRSVAIVPQVGWKFGRWMDLNLMQKILSTD